MSVERFDVRRIAPQPWKNRAGMTREIARGGGGMRADDAFAWRLSLAEIERDAPFSTYAGVDRCIVLLRGAGMRLRSHDGRIDHALTEPLAPFDFPGEAALDAILVAGACSDFNVMTRRGVFRSSVGVQRHAAELPGADITLLLCSAGEWRVGTETLGPLQALLWRASPASIAVRPALDGLPAALLFVRLCHDRGA